MARFVQPLSHAHRFADREVQFAVGLHLQRGRRERRGRTLSRFLGLYAGHLELCTLEAHPQSFHFLLAEDHHGGWILRPARGRIKIRTLYDRNPVHLSQLSVEIVSAFRERSGQVPPRAASETPTLPLHFHDQTHGHGLHAASGKGDAADRIYRRDLLPQQGRQAVTDQAIKDPPGLLRVDLIQIEVAGLVDRFTHRVSRDRVEANAPEAVAVVRSVA